MTGTSARHAWRAGAATRPVSMEARTDQGGQTQGRFGLKRSDVIKLSVAVAGLIIAGLLIAWQLSGTGKKDSLAGEKPRELSPESRGGARFAPGKK